MRTFLLVGATAFVALAMGSGAGAEQHEGVLVEETVTIEDLGVESTGLLPTSPFYFLKEWGRGIQSVFAFNPMAKAELQLKITNEKAAELKAVEEKSGEGEGLSRAIKNYENAQVRLRSRLERVGDAAQNPNVEALLEKIADRAMLHEKLFSEITERKESVKDAAGEARERIRLTLKSVAERDDPDAFAERIENALERTRKVRLGHIRDVEILDNLQEAMPEKVHERIERVRERALERIEREMEKIEEEAGTSEDGREGMERMLSYISGDKARRSVILEELRVRVENQALGEKIREASENLVENESEEKSVEDRKERAEKQVARASALLARLNESIAKRENAETAVVALQKRSSVHLENARDALAQNAFGEAFGQARSAEVASRNALRILSGEKKEEEEDRKDERVEAERESKESEREGLHLRRLRDAERLLQEPVERKIDRIVCTAQYDPVCGADGRTYPNACMARVAGIDVIRKEACEKNERGEENENEVADKRPEAWKEKTESVQDGAVRMFERVRTLLPR